MRLLWALGALAAFTTSGAIAEDGPIRETARRVFGTLSASAPEEVSEPKAVLGRALFWDVRLSVDGRTACASCHYPEAWGADARARSIDTRGARTLNAQTVFNAQGATAGLRWVADRATGALQAIGSVTGSMGFARHDDLVGVLARHGYRARFETVFAGAAEPLSVAHYGSALEAYQRTLRTPSAFDRWMAGDDRALSPHQKRGLERFVDTGCAGCHAGPLLGGGSVQRFGIAEDYWVRTGSTDIDPGLAKVTGRTEDRYLFRVAPLRNVARTAPYFHDGSVAALPEAIRIMARVQLGRALEDSAVAEIEAFLESLTGEVPGNFAPPPGVPFSRPSPGE